MNEAMSLVNKKNDFGRIENLIYVSKRMEIIF